MTSSPPFLTAIQAALLAAVLSAAPAQGQQAGPPNPHSGTWSLEYRVATRPGGQTAVASRGLTPEDVQTINLLMHASRPSFTVGANGVLRWEQREGGQLHWNDLSRLVGKTATADAPAVLRAEGEATATPAPDGSGRTYDRNLTLTLSWSGGSGTGFDHRGMPWTSGGGPPVYEHSQWNLEPVSVRREETAPDVIRETTIFRATRQSASSVYKIGVAQTPLTLVEQIYVKHVHYPRIVPRG